MIDVSPADIVAGLVTTAISGSVGMAAVKAAAYISLDSKLCGRWEGNLHRNKEASIEFPTHVIKCVMVLARPASRQNSGLLYYTRKCTSQDLTLVSGLNELQDYKKDGSTLRNIRFTMEFTRTFHRHLDERVDTSPSATTLACRLEGITNCAPKLYVQTKVPNADTENTWSGVFRKN